MFSLVKVIELCPYTHRFLGPRAVRRKEMPSPWALPFTATAWDHEIKVVRWTSRCASCCQPQAMKGPPTTSQAEAKKFSPEPTGAGFDVTRSPVHPTLPCIGESDPLLLHPIFPTKQHILGWMLGFVHPRWLFGFPSHQQYFWFGSMTNKTRFPWNVR